MCAPNGGVAIAAGRGQTSAGRIEANVEDFDVLWNVADAGAVGELCCATGGGVRATCVPDACGRVQGTGGDQCVVEVPDAIAQFGGVGTQADDES